MGWAPSVAAPDKTAIGDRAPTLLGNDHTLRFGFVADVLYAATDSGLNHYFCSGSTPIAIFTRVQQSLKHSVDLSGLNLRLCRFSSAPRAPSAEKYLTNQLRSFDPPELRALSKMQIARHDICEIEERDIARPLVYFLHNVTAFDPILTKNSKAL